MSKEILGYKVDEKLYKEYMARKYKIQDKEVGLNVIRIYATSEDFRINAPEITEEAQRILEEVRKELELNHVEKVDGKERKEMKYSKFSGYLGEIRELYMQAATERESIQKKMKEAEVMWKEAKEKYKKDDYNRTKAKAEYYEAKREHEEAVMMLEEKYNNGIAEIRTEFEKQLRDFYTPNGSKVDKPTMDLLNSGIRLSGEEVNAMLSGFMGNPTMLRVISDYCEDKKIKDNDVLKYGKTASECGEEEKAMFENVAKMVGFVTGNNEQRASMWMTEESRTVFTETVNREMGKMDNLIIKPEVHEG